MRTVIDLRMRHVTAHLDLGDRHHADARILHLELQQVGEFALDLFGDAVASGKFLGHQKSLFRQANTMVLMPYSERATSTTS